GPALHRARAGKRGPLVAGSARSRDRRAAHHFSPSDSSNPRRDRATEAATRSNLASVSAPVCMLRNGRSSSTTIRNGFGHARPDRTVSAIARSPEGRPFAGSLLRANTSPRPRHAHERGAHVRVSARLGFHFAIVV